MFAVTLIVVILTFVRDNLPREGDMRWLKSFGGMFGDHEVPSHRFNAGEKLLFWGGVFGLGLITIAVGPVRQPVGAGLPVHARRDADRPDDPRRRRPR